MGQDISMPTISQAFPGDAYLLYLAFWGLPIAFVMCGILAGAKGLGGQRGWRVMVGCAAVIEISVWAWIVCGWGGLNRFWSAVNVALETDAVIAYNAMVCPPTFVLGYVVGSAIAGRSQGRSEDK